MDSNSKFFLKIFIRNKFRLNKS